MLWIHYIVCFLELVLALSMVFVSRTYATLAIVDPANVKSVTYKATLTHSDCRGIETKIEYSRSKIITIFGLKAGMAYFVKVVGTDEASLSAGTGTTMLTTLEAGISD